MCVGACMCVIVWVGLWVNECMCDGMGGGWVCVCISYFYCQIVGLVKLK